MWDLRIGSLVSIIGRHTAAVTALSLLSWKPVEQQASTSSSSRHVLVSGALDGSLCLYEITPPVRPSNETSVDSKATRTAVGTAASVLSGSSSKSSTRVKTVSATVSMPGTAQTTKPLEGKVTSSIVSASTVSSIGPYSNCVSSSFLNFRHDVQSPVVSVVK